MTKSLYEIYKLKCIVFDESWEVVFFLFFKLYLIFFAQDDYCLRKMKLTFEFIFT